MNACSVGHETDTRVIRGMCPMHYKRWRRHGDPSVVKLARPAGTFLSWKHVLITNTCWLWTGPLNDKGYGSCGGRPAHRVVFLCMGGVIPAGLELDHLCRVRNCVRIDHLEPVSRGENVRRAHAARKAVAA